MVVVGQPACASFRDGTVLMRCPHCHADISTTTSFETGTCAYLWCIGLCLIGCDMGCCLLPFCCDACKDVVHSCPNCNQVISRYSRM
ncbi:lipopolysaccharide-induced tumor necrosis factor-alpha factor homolog [Mya arenaria]|nr:lipopolysaccharide-induced tumor necrosis factor-alpha factor homolog [Mya arenaria]